MKVITFMASNTKLVQENTENLSNLIGFIDLLIQIDLQNKHDTSKQTKVILNYIIKRDSNE